MKIVLAQRKGIPSVAADLLFDAGYASDQFAKTGTANLALNLMDEGTQTMNALQISDKLQSIGTSINTSSESGYPLMCGWMHSKFRSMNR
ncbi:MAG: insulinase family protein [Flammeovirgaceae bacterium]|nr:insulinase family protein [Flammeovirgaceae bacterium]